MLHTARFVCTTDADGNQIGSFYAGAMSEDAEIKLAPLAAEHGGIDLVLIGAGDPGAMVAHTAECRDVGLKFAADPSQQLARILDDEQVRSLVDGADYLFGNEYEEALIERKSGWGSADMLARVGIRITTLGAAGARIEQQGEPAITVTPVPDAKPWTRPARRRVPFRLPGRGRLGPVTRARRPARQPAGRARPGGHRNEGIQP